MEVPIIGSSYNTPTQNKNVLSSQRQNYLTEKVSHFNKKVNAMKKIFKIIYSDNSGENKL